jgi:hypothetical protein
MPVRSTGGGGGSGTSDHALLTHLDKPSSGHTGFADQSHQHAGGDITSAVANATNASNVDWSGVANKPSTYPATAHTHSGGDITSSVANADAVPWTGVSGKPSTFTPSAHSHAESDVTGLTTDLAAKLPSTSFSGLAKITVGTVAPGSPGVGDLFVDTN